MPLKYVFVILHIITAAAWFGIGLRLAAQARLALRLESSAALTVADDTLKAVRLMGIFLLLTLVFALGAFFTGGGFAAYPPTYHASLGLMVLLIAVHYLLIGPSWSKMRSALAAEGASAGGADAYRKRLTMGLGIGHLLWLVLLILMFWKFF